MIDLDQNGQNDQAVSNTHDEIEILKQKVSELENNWKRALADYKNLQKRTEEERNDIISFANLVLVAKLLSVLDNLEMLESHVDDMGLKLTVKELKQILKDEGLEEIQTQDKDFDAHTMEAVETVEGVDGKVVEVLQKGYKLKDKIIRPARVRVGKKGI